MRHSRAIIPILLLLAAFIYGTAGAEHYPAELFYFSPDSPQNNLSRLKRNMDDLLSSAGISITFQPFTHLVDLENQLKVKPPAFLFIPQWYFDKNGARLHLHPLLVPVRKGIASYRKILVGMKNTNLTRIRMPHITMAMTSMGPDGETALDSILFSSHGVAAHNINAIIVPKDADALFALALGQVDMALVVKENMDLIAKINPNILQSIHPLLESKPIPMPLLCYTEGVAPPAAVKELKNLLLNGGEREGYAIIMEMLQINGWKAIQP
jgi:ABC transporter, phosphonate, periplasmic substrate-binding protein